MLKTEDKKNLKTYQREKKKRHFQRDEAEPHFSAETTAGSRPRSAVGKVPTQNSIPSRGIPHRSRLCGDMTIQTKQFIPSRQEALEPSPQAEEKIPQGEGSGRKGY